MFQCDLPLAMEPYRGEYTSFLNSADLYDLDHSINSTRTHGGTMILWKNELDPFVKVHEVKTPSFLPIVFSPPNLPLTIHVAVYLPTMGKESEFLDQLSALDICIDNLRELYGDVEIYLRGDFNVRCANTPRTSLLNQFCASHNLTQVIIKHPTYHHFTGDGKSDSHLDRLLYPCSSSKPEELRHIYCRNEEPLLNSRHDLLVSMFSIRVLTQCSSTSSSPSDNLIAPRVQNLRTKIFWSEEGVAAYQELIQHHLHRIQGLWLNPSSKSSMSLLLEATNDIMTGAAALTNKCLLLKTEVKEKSKRIPKIIRKSQQLLLKLNRKVIAQWNSPGQVQSLKEKYVKLKIKHRKLERIEHARQTVTRDVKLHNFLTGNSSPHFANIRRIRSFKSRSSKIQKLTVRNRSYTGAAVCDGFFDSISNLKSINLSSLEDSPTFSAYSEDFRNIMDICAQSERIPSIKFTEAVRILDNLKPDVNDYYSITPKHFINAGPAGYRHFFMLLNGFIDDLNSIKISEVNTVYACILFKGHGKEKTSDRSYRTISTCPLIAKGLDSYIRDLNIEVWKANEAETQFQAEGSSHELASVLLTECVQYSLYSAKKPIYILYLDAKSAFDSVIRQLLIRKMFLAGTSDQALIYINHRLENRATYLDWDRQIMGPILDEKGVEQGGVNSDYYYKIFGKDQITICQASGFGVSINGLVTSAIGQADDTALVSNSLGNIQNLLTLAVDFCDKNHVTLCSDKTKLQVMTPPSLTNTYPETIVYLKGSLVDVSDEVEHLGIVRSVHGNKQNLLNRFTNHKKALGGVLHTGMARHHRGNPAASIRTEKIFGSPVLFSGLGSLCLSSEEINLLDTHYNNTLQNLMRLYPRTPRCVISFMAGSLPGCALLHLRQFSLCSLNSYWTVPVYLKSSLLPESMENMFLINFSE